MQRKIGRCVGRDVLDDRERAYLEHLVFGIALALIYESRSASNGIDPDDE